MVKLRLRRMGAINQPFYRIVAMDSRVSRDGKYIECVGWYDPKPTPSKINIDKDRALYWLSVGAQPSDTVRSLLRKAGILQIRHEQK
ncbi:MAG TPA: 30S ribosomal protein S16, partial [Candidatus Syntrophosphaera sp.]|nr:30S ribosomal protein S16 [Candidatus Syntrophosphaera sp.]